MAIYQSAGSLDSEVLRLLAHYKEVALEKFDKYFGSAFPPLSEDRMLAFWEHLEGRREWDDIPKIEEWYGALLLGPILQLQRWIEEPAPCFIPSGKALGNLVLIGLLMADATAQLEAREKSQQRGEASVEEMEQQIIRNIAKRAVSQRSDQQLKPGWLEHCKRVTAEGRTVNRLSDLLDAPGYAPEVMTIQPATLRRWASEVGIRFKAGRPKTNRSRSN